MVISGDVNVQQSLALAARYFSDIKPVQETQAGSAPSLVFPAGNVSLVKAPDAVDQTTLRKAWGWTFPRMGTVPFWLRAGSRCRVARQVAPRPARAHGGQL